MTYPSPLGPAERSRQLDQLDEELAQQRFLRQTALPVPTTNRLHDLAVLDEAIPMIEARLERADIELREAQADAGPAPGIEEHRLIVKLERRAGELFALRQRAVARRDLLERGPAGPFC